jgi:hypothetical protein
VGLLGPHCLVVGDATDPEPTAATSLERANQLLDRVVQSVSKAWNAHRTAMEANGAYRQAFYSGGTALLSAGTTRNLWMAVIGMLLSLCVAVFGPIKPVWSARPLSHWDEEDSYDRW